jgi:hypothetical protein
MHGLSRDPLITPAAPSLGALSREGANEGFPSLEDLFSGACLHEVYGNQAELVSKEGFHGFKSKAQ